MYDCGANPLGVFLTAHFSNIQAVTFDFYNTLVYHRTGRGRGASVVGYLEDQGWEPDPWEHQVLYDVFDRHGVEYDPDQPQELKKQYLQRLAERLFQRLNVQLSNATAADHAEELWNILGPDSLAVFPDVHGLLTVLREAGYAIAVVSNWQCGLRHFCWELGIGDCFDHILASAEVGLSKPNPEIFLEACWLLGMPAERVLHIGDSLTDDWEGAKGAGLQALLIEREERREGEKVGAISRLDQLPPLLGLE